MTFNPRNILVIDFGQLGDVVMSLPALRAVREKFPMARITVAVGKPGGEIINIVQYACLRALDANREQLLYSDLHGGIKKEFLKEGRMLR